MSKRNSFIGGEAQTIKVNFEDDRIGILDLSNPRSVVWAKMFEYLQKNNRPVYVEIEPDTNIITRLSTPEAAKVWEIK